MSDNYVKSERRLGVDVSGKSVIWLPDIPVSSSLFIAFCYRASISVVQYGTASVFLKKRFGNAASNIGNFSIRETMGGK